MARQAGRAACLILIVAATALTVPTGAAAVVPGVPDPVAPGVPGNGRAWELVTPSEPTSGVLGEDTDTMIGASGNGLSFISDGPMPGAVAGLLFNPNLAMRGPGGWQTRPMSLPPRRPNTFLWPLGFAADFSAWLMYGEKFDQASGLWVRGIYRVQAGGGSTELFDTGVDGWNFFDTSDDLQRFTFTASGHLLPGDAGRTGGSSIYEVDGSTLSLVDVNSDGSLVSACGSSPNAVSNDGERIFFASNPDCGPFARVFLREDGETTEISASRCTLPDCGSPFEVTFSAATPSGGSAFFVTRERLTDDDLDGEFLDLYRYDVADGSLTLVSAAAAAADSIDVYPAPVRPSADGSRVYFLTGEPLWPGEGVAGTENLYLADADGLHFVAAQTTTNIRASADGRYALFSTAAPLGEGDSDGNVDLYRYDAETEAVAQVSGGVGGRGNGAVDVAVHALADDGRAIFSTEERLLPQDSNDTTDIYEWGEDGAGLVTAGIPAFAARFVGAVPKDGTVFFETNATLLGVDRDGGDADFYAARVGGGFPEPPAPRPGCEGQVCLAAAPSARALRPSPPSAGKAGARIEAGKLDAAARRLLVAKGKAALLVEVPAAGRLVAKGTARLGGGKRTVVTGAVAAEQAGPVRLPLRLTAAGRAGLARGKALRVSLALRLKGLRTAHRTSFTIGGER